MTKLNDGEHLCPECKGKTIVIQTELMADGSNKIMACPICCGSGKLDWIDYIRGAKDLSAYPDYRQSFFEDKRNILLAAKHGITTKTLATRLQLNRDVYRSELNKLRREINNLIDDFERKLNII